MLNNIYWQNVKIKIFKGAQITLRYNIEWDAQILENLFDTNQKTTLNSKYLLFKYHPAVII